MKKQVRRGVFETNSSSTHSITMMMKEDYKRWKSEELYLFEGFENFFPEECRPRAGKLYTKDEVIEFLRAYDKELDYDDEDVFYDARKDEEFKSYDDENDLESYYDEFTTPNGDTVVAFGEYGYDG